MVVMTNEIYPLTYEYKDSKYPYRIDLASIIYPHYYIRNIDISHIWSASEMFLLLTLNDDK